MPSKSITVKPEDRCDLFPVRGPDENGYYFYACKNCRREPIKTKNKSEKRVFAICRRKLSLFGKLKRFSKEVIAWFFAGRPLRSQQEILTIYEQHCQPCENFTPTNTGGSCQKCGCRLDRKRSVLNKIAMATSKCPVGRW